VDVEKVAEAYRAKFGLDQPIWRQYINYWGDIFRFDLGVSLVHFPETVLSRIRAALPWTVSLMMVATLIAFGLGTLFGALLAWPRTPAVFHVLVSPLALDDPLRPLGHHSALDLRCRVAHLPAGRWLFTHPHPRTQHGKCA
jgi:ABC-type microcin C transport system permease subunit YejB